MSGSYDPYGGANAALMQRMFRRQRPGEARQLFPMDPEAPPPAFQPPFEAGGPQSGMAPPPMPMAPPVVPQPPAPAMPPPNPMFGGVPPMPGSMPTGPIAEPPQVAGPNPYQPPAQRTAMTPPPPDGQMTADQLNMLVLALQNGQGGDGDVANRLRSAMQLGNPNMPQAPGVG